MKIRFNRYARERSFRSAADVVRYAEEQKSKFEAVRNSSDQAYQWWARALAGGWSSVGLAAAQEGATENTIHQALRSNPVFPYESPLTRALDEMSRLGKAQAAQEIVPFLTGAHDGTRLQSMTVMQLDARATFITSIALENTSRRGQEYTSFEAILQEHEGRLASMLEADHQEMDEKRRTLDDLVASSRERFAEMADGASDRFEKLGSQISDDIIKWRAQWHEAYNAFLEQLATETAVKLWSDRSTNHENRYRTFRRWTIGFGLAGVSISLVWIFAGFAFARFVFPDDSTAQLASYAAGSLALFTLLIWGLRVLVRSMMSEDHLSTDASARSALAHTYLALTKEQAATPEDRAIILAALFAPVSDGLVRDDGMPALSPTSIAAQLLTNPSR